MIYGKVRMSTKRGRKKRKSNSYSIHDDPPAKEKKQNKFSNTHIIIELPIKLSDINGVSYSGNDNVTPYNDLGNSNKIIPTKINFKSKKFCPKKTSLRCYHCTYHFNSLLCSIPIKYVKGTFYVYGCFCSFECALAYLLDKNNIHKKEEKISLLYLLHKEMNNLDKIVKIKPAPPKETLVDYGGTLTIEEFRKSNINYNTEYNICIPPMIPISHKIEHINTKDCFYTNKETRAPGGPIGNLNDFF